MRAPQHVISYLHLLPLAEDLAAGNKAVEYLPGNTPAKPLTKDQQ